MKAARSVSVPKPILITGNLASALGYAGFAFVDRPWQAFVCSAVGGAGFGVAGHREPGSEPDPGLSGAARLLDRAPAESQATSVSAAARRLRASSSLPPMTSARSRRSTSSTASPSQSSRWLCSWGSRIPALRMLRAESERLGNRLPSSCSRSALPDPDRRQHRARDDRRRAVFQHPRAVCEGAHALVGPGEIGVVIFINTFFIVVAQIPATRVVKRMRRTHALAASSALAAIGPCSRSCSQR